MAKYLHIKKKIRSVKSTRKITKAMELVSGSKLRRAQERLGATRPYQEKLHEINKTLSSFKEGLTHPLVTGRPIKNRGLVVLASDRGLCGAYNSNLFKMAANWIESQDTPVKILAVGRRARNYFSKRIPAENIIDLYSQPSENLELPEIRPIGDRILNAFYNEEVDSVHLLYAQFKSALVNIPTITQLIPFSLEEEEGGGENADFIFEPEPAKILEHLLPRMVMMEVVGYLAESFTSEHGARMVAMQNATKNADEMIDWLTLKFNKERQTSITQEILEVVSGANALEG